ncbi:MAG: UDP-N-acetylmuramyl-tripeptide synthetase [Eubacteriales bacterium]
MNLQSFLTALGDVVTESSLDATKDIQNIAYDSQKVSQNTLFLCKGAAFKEAYLKQAQEKGATCYLSAVKYDVDMDYILVSDIRLALGIAVCHFFGDLGEKLSLVGITGTKGKSTTALYIRGILDAFLQAQEKEKSALLCSVLTYNGETETPAHLTTEEPIELYKHLETAIEHNISHLTMEVSSQAVKYHRIYGLTFEIGCYLNIGSDHISPKEHPDFEDYFASKLKFFPYCKNLVIHLDGICTETVLSKIPPKAKVLSCSSKDEKADIFMVKKSKEGYASRFTVRTPRYTQDFLITRPGYFNIDNALVAIAVAEFLEIPQEHIAQGLLQGAAPGRMELFSSRDEKNVILVDYAHNRLSYEALFHMVEEEFPNRKIILLFGCPGYKALDRRVDLAEISDARADFTFITEEDPGMEPVEEICADIAKNFKSDHYAIEVDRVKAIKDACAMFPEEDKIVLLLGKGEERDQKRGSLYVACPSDIDVAKMFLEAYEERK